MSYLPKVSNILGLIFALCSEGMPPPFQSLQGTHLQFGKKRAIKYDIVHLF